MEKATINFLHFCDAATIDASGKINILGIFNRLFVPGVPHIFARFTVVISLGLKNFQMKQKNISIKFFGPKNEELAINPPISLDLPINIVNTNKTEDINLVLDIHNIQFTNLGEQKIVIYLNGKEIASRILVVEERKIN